MEKNNIFDLSEYDNVWGTTKAPESNTEEVPDGKYLATIDRVEWKESKNGNRYLSWGLKVTEGQHTGRYVWKRSMLNNAQSLGFLKKDLETIGLHLEKLSDLNLELLLNLPVNIAKKTTPSKTGGEPFSNVYITNVVGMSAGKPEKEIPF